MHFQAPILFLPYLLHHAISINDSPTVASPNLAIAPAVTMIASTLDSLSPEDPPCWTFYRTVGNEACSRSLRLNCPKSPPTVTTTTWSTTPGAIDSCPTTRTIDVPKPCQTTCANIGLTMSFIRSYPSYGPGCFTATETVTQYSQDPKAICAVPWCVRYVDWTLVPPHDPACPTTPTLTRTKKVSACAGCKALLQHCDRGVEGPR